MYDWKKSDCRLSEAEEIENKLTVCDMKKEKCPAGKGGVVVACDPTKKQIKVSSCEEHPLIIGGTGSRKTRSVIVLSLISLACAGESMIINDVKGEIYRMVSGLLKRKGYKIYVLNLRDPLAGDCFNPLEEAYKKYKQGDTSKAYQLIAEFAEILFKTVDSRDDPFWKISSTNYFVGLCLLLIDLCENPEQFTIQNVYELHAQGYNKIKDYLKFYKAKNGESNATVLLSEILDLPRDTRASVFGVFASVVSKLCFIDDISDMLSRSSFSVDDFLKEDAKIAVFMINRDETSAYSLITSAIISQLYCGLVERAEKNGGALPNRLNFVLDEFNSLTLEEMPGWISTARSRKIRFFIAVQTLKQLDYAYGADSKVGECIIDNCSTIVYLHSPADDTTDRISKWVGEYYDADNNRSVRLVTANTLRHLQKTEEYSECLFVRFGREYPFFTRMFDYSFFLQDPAVPIKSRLLAEPKRIDYDAIDHAIVEDVIKQKDGVVNEMANDWKHGTLFNTPVTSSSRKMQDVQDDLEKEIEKRIKEIDAALKELEDEE